jgi:hypothetical protein
MTLRAALMALSHMNEAPRRINPDASLPEGQQALGSVDRFEPTHNAQVW